MELRNPKVRAHFVDHVMNLQNPEDVVLPKPFLSAFVSLLFPSSEYLKSIPNAHFPISMHAAAKLFEVKPRAIKEIIDPSGDHKAERSPERLAEFVEGRDFTKGKKIKVESGGVTRPYFLTVSCLKRAAMLMKEKNGRLARYYFDLVSMGYEDFMGESIWERLKKEPEDITREKTMNPQYFPQKEPGNYDYVFEMEGRPGTRYIYHGITDDLNTRMQRHSSTKPYIIQKVDFEKDFDPELEEVCESEFYAPYNVAIPDAYRGTKSVSVYDEKKWPEIKKFCHEEIRHMREKYLRKFSPPPSPIWNRIPNTAEESPLFYKGKRKRAYTWLDNDVVKKNKEGKLEFQHKKVTIEDALGKERGNLTKQRSNLSDKLLQTVDNLNNADKQKLKDYLSTL